MAIAAIQTVLLVLMGPTVLFYGPAVHKSVMFVQALFAANYIAFVGAAAGVDAFTAFDVWDKFVVLATGTLTLTFTAIKSQKARAISQGAVLGVLIATPLTNFMRTMLYNNWVGCTGYGAKSTVFPDGEPQGCDLNSVEFQVSFQLSKTLFWAITAGMMYIGKKVTIVSVAMTGSSMVMKGLIDLITNVMTIAMPDLAAEILGVLTPIRTFIGYGLAGVGVVIQLHILQKTVVTVGAGEKKEVFTVRTIDQVPKTPLTPVFKCFVGKCMRRIIVPLTWFDKFLTLRMEGKAFLPSTDDMKAGAEKYAREKTKKAVDSAKKMAADKVSAATGGAIDIEGAIDSATKDLTSEIDAAVDGAAAAVKDPNLNA